MESLVLLLLFSATILLIVLVWKLAKFEWLDNICTFLVLSLPFERIPSLEVGGGSVRLSQITILIGFLVFLVLLIKGDDKLKKLKLNKINWFIIAFLLLSIPSLYFIIDFRRFIITYIGTLLVFGALFLLSNFAQNIYDKIFKLSKVLVGVSIFGVYQFVGDMIGLPIYLTGLREQYTKIIFGVPRVHATALEPLYFAGMLFLPIFFMVTLIIFKKDFILFQNVKSGNRLNFLNSPQFILSFFIIIFLSTISKGGMLSITVSSFVLLFLIFSRINLSNFTNYISKILLFGGGSTTLLYIFSNSFQTLLNSLVQNFFATFTFQFASSVERLEFLRAAFFLLPQNVLFGLGSGQYGAWVKNTNIINLPASDSFLIVNNVYLEVWLEFGLLSLIAFLFMISYPMSKNFKFLFKEKDWNTENNIARLVLISALLTYYIQWFTFSPIFIMPIFILLGLLARLSTENT